MNGYEKDEEISDSDEGSAEKVPPTRTAALEASETFRDLQFNSRNKRTFSRLDELKKNLFEKYRKQKQSFIVNYFLRKY